MSSAADEAYLKQKVQPTQKARMERCCGITVTCVLNVGCPRCKPQKFGLQAPSRNPENYRIPN